MRERSVRTTVSRAGDIGRIYKAISLFGVMSCANVLAQDEANLPPEPKIIQTVAFRNGPELWIARIEVSAKGRMAMGTPYGGNPGFHPEFRGGCHMVWELKVAGETNGGRIDLKNCFFVLVDGRWTVNGTPAMEVFVRDEGNPPLIAFRQYASNNGDMLSFFTPAGAPRDRKLSRITFVNQNGDKTIERFGYGWYWGKLQRTEGIFWGNIVDDAGNYLFIKGYDNAQWGSYVEQYSENVTDDACPVQLKKIGFFSSQKPTEAPLDEKMQP